MSVNRQQIIFKEVLDRFEVRVINGEKLIVLNGSVKDLFQFIVKESLKNLKRRVHGRIIHGNV